MKVTEYIPHENFNTWYMLFKRSSGRLLANPIVGKRVWVSYTFDDMDSYKEMTLAYIQLTTPIVETRSGFWKKLRSRIKWSYARIKHR